MVPVANRPDKTPVKVSVPHISLNIKELFGLVVIILFIVLLVQAPLRNYIDQRAQIAHTQSSIVELQNRKDTLLEELDRYQSESYIKEQARARLGVIERGEFAYRVVDPGIENKQQTKQGEQDVETHNLSWYEVLWDSVTVIEQEEESETVIPDNHIPIAPAQ
ncbi:Septum formation initiator protein [Corynebacterium kutscheri]|uniref:Septum formation initiator n=1 Tax=Corynebacterium kutscheri TaxID=35755 RepID=A0A0F6TDP1_9CORY|nr:septum formation initiator [Corynebacterium kutscheri]VEH09066.1 Septum formation initiator protein [Corynebacterium kutscheri]VEH10117.1 Septum formation initiator protein [Corynebacterium kutscheri]VEH80199.1 Septum formation initiator protein [Corynebacterium kutscheri]